MPDTSSSIQDAAAWFAAADPKPRPAVPELRRRFGLTVPEACQAIGRANALRRTS